MSELIEVVQVDPAIIKTDNTPKTLEQQREEICMRLHINRHLLEQKLLNTPGKYFPRSATMRFLSNQSTRHIMQRFAGAAFGFQAFKSLRYGFSLFQFARSAYGAFKATRNVVKAKEGKSI